jgi:hypothetical protein
MTWCGIYDKIENSIEIGKKAVGIEGGSYSGGTNTYDEISRHEETRKFSMLGRSAPEPYME